MLQGDWGRLLRVDPCIVHILPGYGIFAIYGIVGIYSIQGRLLSITPMVENQMEKNIEHRMESGDT